MRLVLLAAKLWWVVLVLIYEEVPKCLYLKVQVSFQSRFELGSNQYAIQNLHTDFFRTTEVRTQLPVGR